MDVTPDRQDDATLRLSQLRCMMGDVTDVNPSRSRNMHDVAIRDILAHTLHEEGHSYSAIARAMGYTPSGARAMVGRAEAMRDYPRMYEYELYVWTKFRQHERFYERRD